MQSAGLGRIFSWGGGACTKKKALFSFKLFTELAVGEGGELIRTALTTYRPNFQKLAS